MNNDPEASRITAICPRCGTTNSLTTVQVQPHEDVACSHCGAELGRLADLKTAQQQEPKRQ